MMKAVLVMLGVVVGVSFAIGLSGRGYFNRPPHFDIPEKSRVQDLRPEVVVIGNSLVKEGVDEKILSTSLNSSAMTIYAVGSGSAFWYLAFKNAVIASAVNVPIVAIVFTDDGLTNPTAGVYGYPKKHLDQMVSGCETLLDERAYWSQMSFIERVLTRFFPPYRLRNECRTFVEKATHQVVSWFVPSYNKYDVDESVEHVFSDKNMISELVNKRQLAGSETQQILEFEVAVEKSFLPEMIRISKDAGIRLVFVRYKRRRVAEGYSDGAQMTGYLNKLKAYLTVNDVDFIDFTNDQRIGIQHYAYGNHFNREGCDLFSTLLGEKIRDKE